MTKIPSTTPAVFMDRDGTVCEEVGYLRDVKNLRLIPGSAEAIRRINARGWKAVIISNQSGIARGYTTVEEVDHVNQALLDMLALEEARIDRVYYCPHHPQGNPPFNIECGCRKPANGMLTKAAQELDIDLSQSLVIGDKLSDVETAHRLHIPGILVRTGFGEQELRIHNTEGNSIPTFVAANLGEAIQRFFNI